METSASTPSGDQAHDVSTLKRPFATDDQAGTGIPETTVDAPEAPPVELQECHRMARLTFASWTDFDEYFEQYMADTFQPFRLRSSCSIESYKRNRQKTREKQKHTRAKRVDFPDDAGHHHRIYMCTHAMKARCRGAKMRPGQKYRGLGCPAKINAKITSADNGSDYTVVVTDQVVSHNHPVGPDVYAAYPDVMQKSLKRTRTAFKMDDAEKQAQLEGVLQSIAQTMANVDPTLFDAQLARLQDLEAEIAGQSATV